MGDQKKVRHSRDIIKNYTTSISIEKTIGEIEKILSDHGADSIYKRYENGVPVALAFNLIIDGNSISFKLPIEEDKILALFKDAVKAKKIPQRYANDYEQARRTGWRIIHDWVDSQMAIVEIHIAKMEQVFLPYLYDVEKDETLFQKFEKRGFAPMLEDKRE